LERREMKVDREIKIEEKVKEAKTLNIKSRLE
jgi:hypothetical protein